MKQMHFNWGDIDLTENFEIVSKNSVYDYDTDQMAFLRISLYEDEASSRKALIQGKKDSEQVTVHMIVEVISDEFPEFLLAVAEENFIRGYHQALADVDTGRAAEQKEMAVSNEL